MPQLTTLNDEPVGDVSHVFFNDDESQVGFVIDGLTDTEPPSSTSYRLHLDDRTLKVLPHSREGASERQRWACYVVK